MSHKLGRVIPKIEVEAIHATDNAPKAIIENADTAYPKITFELPRGPEGIRGGSTLFVTLDVPHELFTWELTLNRNNSQNPQEPLVPDSPDPQLKDIVISKNGYIGWVEEVDLPKFTVFFHSSIRGPVGQKGDKGDKGDAGLAFTMIGGIWRKDTLPSLSTVQRGYGYAVEDNTSTTGYCLYFLGESGTAWSIIRDWGGVPGPRGEQGLRGERGERGEVGPQGPQGAHGGPQGRNIVVRAMSLISAEAWDSAGIRIGDFVVASVNGLNIAGNANVEVGSVWERTGTNHATARGNIRGPIGSSRSVWGIQNSTLPQNIANGDWLINTSNANIVLHTMGLNDFGSNPVTLNRGDIVEVEGEWTRHHPREWILTGLPLRGNVQWQNSGGSTPLANNLITTVSGSALDARQGRALNIAKADINNPVFTGRPMVPHPQLSENSNQIPTTNWVNNRIAQIPIPSPGGGGGLFGWVHVWSGHTHDITYGESILLPSLLTLFRNHPTNTHLFDSPSCAIETLKEVFEKVVFVLELEHSVTGTFVYVPIKLTYGWNSLRDTVFVYSLGGPTCIHNPAAPLTLSVDVVRVAICDNQDMWTAIHDESMPVSAIVSSGFMMHGVWSNPSNIILRNIWRVNQYEN